LGIISWIVFGLLAGVIAKLLMPGRDPGGCIITMLLGIAGAFVGGVLYRLLTGREVFFQFDLGSLVVAILGAVIILAIYRLVVGRRAWKLLGSSDKDLRMAQVVVQTERLVAANPQRVHAFLADYQNNRPRILSPEYFRDYRVERGGDGAGTVISYRLRAGGRERPYRMRVEEPNESGLLIERDIDSSLVTTWALTPAEGGERTLVSLMSRWEGAGGIGGFFERTFAPRALRRIYDEVLEKLSATV
jgi:uncharacterized membrane protein YeaQ/YmgE (transglycosylase-associated protein family)